MSLIEYVNTTDLFVRVSRLRPPVFPFYISFLFVDVPVDDELRQVTTLSLLVVFNSLPTPWSYIFTKCQKKERQHTCEIKIRGKFLEIRSVVSY